MQHIPFSETPVTILPFLSENYHCNLLCKRDDLFPAAGGGSKARMLQYILHGVSTAQYDLVLTAGGPHSNFNRACALMCARLGLGMHLVAYGGEQSDFDCSNNFRLCRYTGTKVTLANKSEVAETLSSIQTQYKAQGLRVKYIWGGGRELAGIFAYYDAVKNLRIDCPSVDELYVACGTGTTLAGICAGMQERFPNAMVHAISVAREWKNEEKVLLEDMEILNAYTGRNFTLENLVFHDSFLCGGYGKADNEEMRQVVRDGIFRENLMLDTTYSGKALYGMHKTLEDGHARGKAVMFWHTGGIYNMLTDLP